MLFPWWSVADVVPLHGKSEKLERGHELPGVLSVPALVLSNWTEEACVEKTHVWGPVWLLFAWAPLCSH